MGPSIAPREKGKKMAVVKEVVVTRTDDLTGEEFSEGAGETVTYELNGTRYEIDLNTKNATAFHKAFEKYIKVSREKGTRRTAGSQANPEVAAIREWARSKGFEVNDRGRIPQHIVDKYNAQKK
jgi:hypothetical protein